MEKKWGLNAWRPLLQPLCPPTCSSWALITFGILTHHVQIFSNPGRFKNLPAHHTPHHPHHNPSSSPPSTMPPPILPPPTTTSITSTPCTPNGTQTTTTQTTSTSTLHPTTPTPPPIQYNCGMYISHSNMTSFVDSQGFAPRI